MSWLQLRLHTAYPEFADEVLQAQGASAVSFVDAEDDPVLEPAPGETPLWTHTVTLALFPESSDLAPVLAALHEQLPDGETLQATTELIEDQDWVRVWLKDCPPLKFGDRLWICPREKLVEDHDAVIVQLDPGLAFGTGTHPSTALCLDWLATNEVAGKTVLDYGCGSGILAIAACKLGAASAVATDIDPQAITATLSNAAENAVAESLTTVAPDQEFVPFPADIVLANILARPLIELAPLLASSVRQDGHIVLAGLLERQAAEVRAAYAPWFDLDEDKTREGWSRVSGRCRLPALINPLQISDSLGTAGQPRVEHFPLLRAQGYEAIINLAMPTSPNWLADEAALAQAQGLAYEHIGIEWTRPTVEHLQKFFAAMHALQGRRVFVHCALNKRVSAFVFLYRVLQQGEAPQDCLPALHSIWQPDAVWSRYIEAQLQQKHPDFRLGAADKK